MQNSIDVFNKTLEKSNLWLKELKEDAELINEHQAYSLLRAVLHVLRDRLPLEEAAHFGAQLPMLIRGLYYEGFKPLSLPHKEEKTAEEFIEAIYEHLLGIELPIDLADTLAAVFTLLERRISTGEINHIKSVLPKRIRQLWEESLMAKVIQ